MKSKLLILDDDVMTLNLLKKIFSESPMELLLESDADSALERIKKEHPNVALFDVHISGRNGLEVLQEAKKLDPSLAVIMMTGYNTTQTAIEAMKYGAYDFVTKPFDMHYLKKLAQKALESNLLSRQVRYTRNIPPPTDHNLDEDLMIGSSPEMMEIWKMVGRVADSEATVLVTGETGTGKELLARAIYSNSKRRNRPFLAVNCAALPENLLESELFGHEKGAFTDAHCRKIGKFEQCNGGTIFLDEIGEMSLANQSKLLRALETREFERVGGTETIKVDVRVIAATNRSLLAAVKEKTFRLDLFYRLRVITFFLPPLRERPEDIPLLIDLFLRRYARKHGKPVKELSPDAHAILREYPWEGNIRELQNVISSAVVLSSGTVLTEDDFTALKGETEVKGGAVISGATYAEMFKNMLGPLFDTICRKNHGNVYESVSSGLEQALIHLALDRSERNQVMAAKLLGISRNTLRDRIDRFNLHGGD
jgi:DNA-binding NtrC family response regulator